MLPLHHIFMLLTCLSLYFLPQIKSVRLVKPNTFQHGQSYLDPPFFINSGEIVIPWPSYTIEADFTDTGADLQFTHVDKTRKAMAVSLYTNETFLGGECSNYLKFDCSKHNCFPRPHEKRIVSHPYSIVKGYTMHTEIYLDYSFFSNYYMDAVYAENCSSHSKMVPDVVYGTIGLGLSRHGEHNFMGDYPTFSIYLNDSESTDQLLFTCDLRKINPRGKMQTLTASTNWELPFENVTLGNLTIPFNGNTIFDLNSPFIGLPAPIYKSILSELKDSYNVSCYYSNSSTYGCVFKGNLTDLPLIQIGQGVMIPSQIYLQKRKNDGIYMYNLMIVALSVEASVSPYMKVTNQYKNYIILGTPFMKHYYTCFESKPKGYQISVYEKGENNNNDSVLVNYVGIGFGIFIPIALFSICCCIALQKDKMSLEDRLNELRKPIIEDKQNNEVKNTKDGGLFNVEYKDQLNEINSVTPEFKIDLSSFATISTERSFGEPCEKGSEGDFSFSLSD